VEIWISRCKKQAKCRYCTEAILKSEPILMGREWRSYERDGSTRQWVRRYYWHPNCWLEEALAKLDKLPEATGSMGRKPLVLSAEDKQKRFAILRKRARIAQRLHEEIEMPEWQSNIDRIIALGNKVEQLKEEIEPLGGIPRSWL